MKTIDLTHTLGPDMPVFPGSKAPEITCLARVEQDGYFIHEVSFNTHNGTHIDSPAHILSDGRTLDRLPIGQFVGKGMVIDLTNFNKSKVDIIDLKPYEENIKKSEFILFRTGWSGYWGEEKYFNDFPVLSIECAHWLSNFELKGIGIDAISLDETESTTYSVHKIILKRCCIIENLTNLDQLPASGFIFSCLPMKFEEADGSPVRAVAILL